MISKERVFIVSSNVDDSIKRVSIQSDVRIFHTFAELEKYVDVTPIDVSTIIVNGRDLPFTNSSMNRLLGIVNSTFVSISNCLYYLTDDADIKVKVDTLVKRNSYMKIKCLLMPSLHAQDVADALSGEAIHTRETVTEIRTYRIRAADYVRSQRDKEGIDFSAAYQSDEDELAGIQDEEVPEDVRASDEVSIQRHVVCSDSIRERCSWVVLKSQYLAMSGKVLVLERDTEYHTLLDMYTKIDVDIDYFDIKELIRDITDTISRIKESKKKIIVVGAVNKIKYSYDVVLGILVANLSQSIDHYIYEASMAEMPYGEKVDLVMPTTVPEVIKAVNHMKSLSSFDDIMFVGLDITNFGIVSISESEFKALLVALLQERILRTCVVKIHGLNIKEVGVGGIFMHG